MHEQLFDFRLEHLTVRVVVGGKQRLEDVDRHAVVAVGVYVAVVVLDDESQLLQVVQAPSLDLAEIRLHLRRRESLDVVCEVVGLRVGDERVGLSLPAGSRIADESALAHVHDVSDAAVEQVKEEGVVL